MAEYVPTPKHAGGTHLDTALPPHGDTSIHVDAPAGPHVDTGGQHVDASVAGLHQDIRLPHIDASIPPHVDAQHHVDTPAGPHGDVSLPPAKT